MSRREYLYEFCSSVLGKLYDYDEQNKTNLVETLEQYFQCNSNISTAAKRMYLHRNTFIYRIEKIKGILGSELKDPEEMLELQMGHSHYESPENNCRESIRQGRDKLGNGGLKYGTV